MVETPYQPAAGREERIEHIAPLDEERVGRALSIHVGAQIEAHPAAVPRIAKIERVVVGRQAEEPHTRAVVAHERRLGVVE